MWTWKPKARPSILTLAIAISLALPAKAEDPDAAWRLLASIGITEVISDGEWRVKKDFPAELKAARDGFEVEGYLVPITAEPYIQTFLLVQDPADCPFCGAGGYGPALEVRLREPLPDLPEFSRIRVRGDLALIDDPETMQSTILEDAVPIVLPDS